jgi:hypothetical protein
VPSLTEARPDLASHPDLVAAVGRACSKNPADRPTSAEGLAAELAGSLGHLVPLPALSPAPTYPFANDPARRGGTGASIVPASRTVDPEPSLPAERGRRLLVSTLVVLGLGLALAGTALYLHTGSAPPETPPGSAPAGR